MEAEMTSAQTKFEEIADGLDDLFASLPSSRREHARDLTRALREVVLSPNEGLGKEIQEFLFIGFVSGILAVIPIGIIAGLTAYFSGLSQEVGQWMIISASAAWAVASAVGFRIGRRFPASFI
jgi:hypothetical protein